MYSQQALKRRYSSVSVTGTTLLWIQSTADLKRNQTPIREHVMIIHVFHGNHHHHHHHHQLVAYCCK